MPRTAIAILSRGPDPLAEAVADALAREGTTAVKLCVAGAASHVFRIEEDTLWVDGRLVAALLLRSRPGSLPYSQDFYPADSAFVDAELSATLLAAASLPSVRSVNRYDAQAWFEGAGWHSWRPRLRAAGVPLSPFFAGEGEVGDDDAWLPYLSGRPERPLDRKTRSLLGCAVTPARPRARSLAVCGRLISGPGGEAAERAARALRSHGVHLVELVTDDQGRVLALDASPVITEPGLVAAACELLVSFYGEHLHRG